MIKMLKIKHCIQSATQMFLDIFFLFKRKKIFICGFMGYRGTSNNWGDDINRYFIEYISDLTILAKNVSRIYRYINVKNYLCIGSVLGLYDNPKMQVWGSGLISSDIKIKKPIGRIFSVRGPLTRKELIKQGIDCPEVYGDPALLVSRYYKPKVVKKYKLGVIPHYCDENNSYLKDFVAGRDDVVIIRMRFYNDWRDIPDMICSCEYIISSSLHGLIVSDSYGIPNMWVRFSDNITGGNFKYLDYFASVGRMEKTPIVINSINSIRDLCDFKLFNVAPQIDYRSIFEACPFKEHLQDYEPEY